MQRRPIQDLAPDPKNPRRIRKERAAALNVSLETYGDIAGIVYNQASSQLVTGHQRVAQIKAAGATSFVVERDATDETDGFGYLEHPKTGQRFPIRLVRWTEARQHLANLTANNPEIQGEFTEEAVALLDGLKQEAEFGALRLDALLAELGDVEPPGAPAPPDEDDVPHPPPTPRCGPGDLWILGEHRLLCGDSFLEEDRARLLQGETVDLIVTDPPYAIYGSSTGIGADIADDKMVRPFFERLFSFCREVIREFGHVYACCDWRSWAAIWEGARRAQLSAKNCLVWDKGGGGLGSSYAMAYELVGFFARLPKQTAMKSTTKTGQRTVHAPNILRYPRVTGDEREHNAAKPVAMIEELIDNSSEEGEIVADWFGGSGTTLIAAEKRRRRARVMEMEPRCCDVIIRRWERVTGHQAVKAPPQP